MDGFWLGRTATLPGMGWGIVRSISADGRNGGKGQQEHERQRNQKPTHGLPTVSKIPRTSLRLILMTDSYSVKERSRVPLMPYCTIGCAMIHRLITVYITISASMGYWLPNARARSVKVLMATRCAR